MLYIHVDEFMLHDLMAEAGRDHFSEEGYEWIVNEYADYYNDIEFDAVFIDSQFTECEVSYAVTQYGYLLNSDEYTNEDGSIDPYLFVIALSGHTVCDLLDNGNVIYEEF